MEHTAIHMEHTATLARSNGDDAGGARTPLTPAERTAIGVVGSAVTVFGLYGWLTGSPNTVPYLFTVGALGAVVARLRRAALPAWLVSALAVLAVAHLAGGLVRVGDDVLYNASLHGALLRYDHFVHSSGVFVGTVMIWTVLVVPALPVPKRSSAVVVLAVLGGLGLGALNETIEFLSTTAHGASHVGGYTNTGWDLVSNVAGAVAAGLYLTRTHRASDA
jgi:hypothetical protein